jgi:hypothetical protein
MRELAAGYVQGVNPQSDEYFVHGMASEVLALARQSSSGC